MVRGRTNFEAQLSYARRRLKAEAILSIGSTVHWQCINSYGWGWATRFYKIYSCHSRVSLANYVEKIFSIFLHLIYFLLLISRLWLFDWFGYNQNNRSHGYRIFYYHLCRYWLRRPPSAGLLLAGRATPPGPPLPWPLTSLDLHTLLYPLSSISTQEPCLQSRNYGT